MAETHVLAEIPARAPAGHRLSNGLLAATLGIVALSALIHNAIYYFFYIQPTDLSFTGFFLRSGVAATLYTTVIAVIVMLVAARKQRW